MKYALVGEVRQEATPKLRGVCPNCDRAMVAKCGQRRIWHWSHLGKLECDHWWEPETEWHRLWKDHFPKEWQEVPHTAANGERHIADVKTVGGWVVELQHSPISLEERLSREAFYPRMVWVVDGLRFKRDVGVFARSVAEAKIVKNDPLYLAPYNVDAGIFQRWTPRQSPVFVDFGDEKFRVAGFLVDVPVLWQLLLTPGTLSPVIAAVTRESFIQFCLAMGPLQNILVQRGLPPPIRAYRPPRRRRF